MSIYAEEFKQHNVMTSTQKCNY